MASGWLCLNLASSKKTKQTKKRWIYQAILVKPREVRSLTASQFQKKNWPSSYISQFLLLKSSIPNPITSFPPMIYTNESTTGPGVPNWDFLRGSGLLPTIRRKMPEPLSIPGSSTLPYLYGWRISGTCRLSVFFITWRFLSFFAVYLRIITGTQQIKWHPNLWIQHNPEPSCSKHIDLPTSTNLHPKTHMYTLHGFNERPAVKAACGCPVKPRCAGLGLGGGCRCRRLRG